MNCSRNLRDVGLSLQGLRGSGARGVGRLHFRETLLPCGRLLRCGHADSRSHDELLRPGTVVSLQTQEPNSLHGSVAGVAQVLHVPADEGLEEYNVSDQRVQAWLLEVLRVFECEVLAFPVLLCCVNGRDRTGVAIACLLSVLSVPEELIIGEYSRSAENDECLISDVLARIKEAGGPDAFFATADLHRVRSVLLGGASAVERAAAETAALRIEVELMLRNATTFAKAADNVGARYWYGEVVLACAELASRSPAGDAAAALCYQGVAFERLDRYDDACEALAIGGALARAEVVRGESQAEKVAKRTESLLAKLPEWCVDVQVMSASELVDSPGDSSARTLLLAIDDSRQWRAHPCPEAFSWLRAGELATGAAPSAEHLPALESLCMDRVSAEMLGAPKPPEDHWKEVVGNVANVLSSGRRCLLHCFDGFSDSSIGLACFLITHGMDEEVKCGNGNDDQGRPKMTAGEAIEVVKKLRPGALDYEEHEQQVQDFSRLAWGNAIMKGNRIFRPTCPSTSALPALRRGRVVRQPGDGSCLFHSLAFGLGQDTASTLRAEICSFMGKNAEFLIQGTTLADWVRMVSDGSELGPYVKKMSRSSTWGGNAEIFVCAVLKSVNIHVYEPHNSSFKLDVPFDIPGATRTITVCYVGGVHYDGLVLA